VFDVLQIQVMAGIIPSQDLFKIPNFSE